VQAVVAEALAGDEGALGHAEVVEHLGAPGPLELLSLYWGEGLGGNDQFFYGGRRQVEILRLGEVREMQPIARHAEPDGGLEVVDQLELHLGRRIGPGAGPHGADAAVDGGARIEMRDRMHAERKGNMRAIPGRRPDQRPRALESAQAPFRVLGRARVEERPARGAAGAPVLHRRAARLDAELVVEAFRRDLPQLLLGEQRNAAPDVLGVARRDPLLQERRLARARDFPPFALDALEVGCRLGPEQVHVHTPR